jgi:predicted acyltransferase
MKDNQRLVSLDALRGFTIAAMILVNNPGSWEFVYAPLRHKDWNGISPTDLIFPFFVFIVGISIVLAFSKKLEMDPDKSTLVRKIIWRSFKIFGVGIFLNLYPFFDFGSLRIAGVLQRIALVFLFSALLFLFLDWKKLSVVGILILLVYWILMVYVPTPGYGSAMLEPGINMAAWIDSFILPGKMWNGSWDPEGLLSTLPSIATGISGMLVGKLLQRSVPVFEKISLLYVVGFVSAVIGVVWSWNFPINKNLWTSSYVLVSSGLASMTLATLMYFIDVRKNIQLSKPFVVFGSNAISAYVLAEMSSYVFYGLPIDGNSLASHYMNLFTKVGFDPRFVSMMYAFIFILIIYVVMHILYKRKIFIKL